MVPTKKIKEYAMRHLPGTPHQLPGNSAMLAGYQAAHFKFDVDGGVATLTLNRPERKNPLTFDSYAELRDLFRALAYADDVKAVVVEVPVVVPVPVVVVVVVFGESVMVPEQFRFTV